MNEILSRHLRPQDVSLAVSPHDGWREFLENYRKRFGLHKHSTSAEAAKAIGKKYFLDYEAFTFVRNPFSRAYSAYTFTKRTDAKYRPDSKRYQDIKDMVFDDFLKSEYMREKTILAARSQCDWVLNDQRNISVYKLEDISIELPKLMSRLYGVEIDADKMRRANYSADQDDWRKMTPNAKDLIRDLYADDFAFLNYATDFDPA